MDYLNQKENGSGLQAACIFAKDGQKTYKVGCGEYPTTFC